MLDLTTVMRGHVFNFEHAVGRNTRGEETRHGITKAEWSETGSLEEFDQVTRLDALVHYYSDLWTSALTQLVPHDLRGMYFDCIMTTSLENAVDGLQQLTGTHPMRDLSSVSLIGLFAVLDEMGSNRKPECLRRRYLAALMPTYAKIDQETLNSHQLQYRLVACYDMSVANC